MGVSPADQAEQSTTLAEGHSGDAQAGGEYALVCVGIAQSHAILAVAEAIEELTGVIREKCGRWLE